MKVARLVRKSTDDLPEVARQVMLAGFKEKKRYSVIFRELALMGFHIPERTIARRCLDWRREVARREVLGEMGHIGAVLPSWHLDELIGIIERLDLEPDSLLRSRRRIQEAVRKFLKNAGQESAHELTTELLRFRLQTLALWLRDAKSGDAK